MVNTSSDYILCVNDQNLAEAISAIESSSAIILDCEGKDLGQENGSLSLISFRTIAPKPSKTYLIDTISLARDKLKPIFDIIQSSSPTKIVFDGRMDFSALYHGYNISMGGVFDLQLADIQSRSLRGETQDRQLRRLSPFLHIAAVLGQRSSYTVLHKLCGLEQCISEHGIVADSPKGDQLDHHSWLSRPLPEHYLKYASRDIYLIGLLYAHFEMGGYISDELPAQSARYISIWKDKQPKTTDTFKQHPLLPLRILDFNDYSYTKSCMSCQRDLPEAAFSKAAWKGVSLRRCWVCRAIHERNKLQDAWDRDGSDDFYDSADDDVGYYNSSASRANYDWDSDDYIYGSD